MTGKTTREMITSALMIALGLILPLIFHMFGAGSVFLPMHIPILIGGFFAGVPFAMAAGMITPFLSSIFTSMPPLFPIMPIMVVELGVYGTVASLLYRKLKLNVVIALLGSMVAGRIAAGLSVWVLAIFFSVKFKPIAFVTGAISTGLPGIIIQILVVPVIVTIIKEYRSRRGAENI